MAESRDKSVTRRDALRHGLSSVAQFTGGLFSRRLGFLAPLAAPEIEIPNYLDAATAAADWILRSGRTVGDGRAWPVDPTVPTQFADNLYGGTAGVVLFLIEFYLATYRTEYLVAATDGASYLAGRPTAPDADCGLYTGTAGVAWVLGRVHRTSPSSTISEAARRLTAKLRERAREVGDGVEWNPSTDIVSGTAGIGLALLALHEDDPESGYLALAEKAGRRLIATAIPEAGGLKWPLSPGNPRLMPNFSHGTAGVAYFLATLYLRTRRQEFLDGALSGAKYLLSIADTSEAGCKVFHNELDGTSLYYMGWCHGPAGTARLFWQLDRATGSREWREWAVRGARSLELCGVPERRTEGFWNNHGMCCGTAGVGAFFLSLYQATHDRKYWDLAKRCAKVILEAAKRDETGMRWVHAEHRTQPDQVAAQTGYMQGAAGIASLLLSMHLHEQGKRRAHPLPDDPFVAATR